LLKNSIHFKVVKSNAILRFLNEDKFGYTQIGKFITVYPESNPDFVEIANELDKILVGFSAPIIPSDIRLHKHSIIYYRYGVIGNSRNEILLPNGKVVKDKRSPNEPIPSWVEDPFKKNKVLDAVFTQRANHKPLLNRYIILKVLRQKGKGLVALALDTNNNLETPKPQLVCLKQARKLGALADNGIDAIDRLKREFSIMKIIESLDVCPKPIEFIHEEDNAFMSMYVFGNQSLDEILLGQVSFSKKQLMDIYLKIVYKLAKLHRHKVYLLDLHPGNVLVDASNNVLITDFESAFYENLTALEGYEMKTLGFHPSSRLLETINYTSFQQKMIYKDIYALGNILLAIFCPKWYKNITVHKKNKASKSYQEQNIKSALDNIPMQIQNICRKTNLMMEEKYESVADFLHDIQKTML